MITVPVLLSPNGYCSKEEAIQALPSLTYTIHQNLHHLTPPQLAEALVDEKRTICPGIHHTHRSRENFIEKQVFLIDVDPGWSIEQFIHEAEVLNLMPNFVYTTFGHNPESGAIRFRAVYILEESIKQVDQAAMIQKVLLHTFHLLNPGVDSKTFDPTRIFFGGQTIVCRSYSQVTSMNAIVDGFNLSFRMHNKAKSNFNRMKSLYLKENDLDLAHVFFNIAQDKPNKSNTGQCSLYTVDTPTVSSCDNLVQSKDCHKVLISCPSVNAVSIEENISGIQFRPGASTSTKPKVPTRLTEDMKKQFTDRCRLIQTLHNGQHRIPNASLFHVALSLFEYQGGEKWFKEMLARLINNGYEDSRKHTSLSSRHNSTLRNPRPARCECDTCPFIGQCQNKGSMIRHQLDMHRKSKPIRKEVTRRTPDDIFREMAEDVSRDLAIDDKLVYVYKAPCGIGKSELFLSLNLDGTFVAAPTHKLSKELYNRYRAKHENATPPYLWKGRPTIPKLGEKDKTEAVLCQLESMERSTRPLLQTLLERDDVESTTKVSIREYLQSLYEIHDQSLIFGTQKKAVTAAFPKVNTIIFDEDIRNCVLETKQILQGDLASLRNNIRNMEGVDNIKEFLCEVERVESGVPTMIDRDIPESEIEAFRRQDMNMFASSVMFLFRAQAFQRVNAGILCCRKQDLRQDKKYLVFSATASKKMYELLFGDRLVWRDYGQAQLAGRVHLHLSHSFSKAHIKRITEERAIERIQDDQRRYRFTSVVTYKALSEVRDGARYLKGTSIPVVATFGALEGLDALQGESFAIYGTPNQPRNAMAITLFLLTGVYPDSFRDNYDHTIIENDEWIYPAYVSPDETLRQYHIEAVTGDLIQAIGRARLTRKDRDVHVFSNLPCPGGDPWGEE